MNTSSDLAVPHYFLLSNGERVVHTLLEGEDSSASINVIGKRVNWITEFYSMIDKSFPNVVRELDGNQAVVNSSSGTVGGSSATCLRLRGSARTGFYVLADEGRPPPTREERDPTYVDLTTCPQFMLENGDRVLYTGGGSNMKRFHEICDFIGKSVDLSPIGGAERVQVRIASHAHKLATSRTPLIGPLGHADIGRLFSVVLINDINTEFKDRLLQANMDYSSHMESFLVFVESLTEKYEDPSSPGETVATTSSPFQDQDPHACASLLRRSRQETGSDLNFEYFIILDSRSLEDDTVLMVEAIRADEDDDAGDAAAGSDSDPQALRVLTLRAEMSLVNARFLYYTVEGTMREDIEELEQEGSEDVLLREAKHRARSINLYQTRGRSIMEMSNGHSSGTALKTESSSPLSPLGILSNLNPDKKQTKDGQPPKRRGPKPDSKPALTRRQELNRQAQRTHRERKELYIKALEQEVLRLKEIYASSSQERDAYAAENRKLRDLLAQHGISYDPSADPIAFSRPQSNYGPSSGSSMSGSYGPASEGTGSNFSPPPQSNGPGSGSVAASQRSLAQLPSNRLDYDQVGIDFVLTLERPCMDHMQYLLGRAHNPQDLPARHPLENPDDGEYDHMSGHVLMATAPPKAHIMTKMAETYPHQMPADLSTPTLAKLLDLSNRLPIDSTGEITPIMAWTMVLRDPRVAHLGERDFAKLKEGLVAQTRCYGFGAVIEEFEVQDALSTLYAEKTGNVYQRPAGAIERVPPVHGITGHMHEAMAT
nr:hypothetical protein B0A51_10544 [Rachicladosporium sp. CCFEE 5018]